MKGLTEIEKHPQKGNTIQIYKKTCTYIYIYVYQIYPLGVWKVHCDRN